MKRLLLLLLLGVTGCSTSPIVDMWDYFKPGRMYTDQKGRYGGVCQPQGLLPGPTGTIAAPGVPTPVVPPPQIPPPTPGTPVIPPPPGSVAAPFPTVPSSASPAPGVAP
jgi:hypothetical protein